ncbi:MAG: MBL fold metallo-hydrolase [Proteobacteria bacterium]|nr:MBL fold metallo-hydrolase [Pseudomonadota bacterium]MDA0994515.1 MBL fold metallo-hydrolase [Pseudomonadota bacterium]
MKKISLLTILAMVVSGAALAQEGEVSWKSTELEPGLYMLEGVGGFAGGNLGLLTGDDGIVLIDNGLSNLAAMTVASIEKLTSDPVNFVINTHAHGDHAGANAAFTKTGATVVAHDNLRRALLADKEFDQRGIPELTFNDSVSFHLNGHTAYVFHLPSAHTDGDAAIKFTEVNVIHGGDVFFNKVYPFIDLDGGGSVDGFIAGQQAILAKADDNTRIIPGHGPLANKADLQSAVNMLIDARSRVKALVDAGKSKDEVLTANPLSAYENWSWDFITTEVMTNTIYRSLTTE